MIVTQLLDNLAILLALGILYNFLTNKFLISTVNGRILAGVLFGLISIVGMSIPVEVEPGVVFDGRSIILGVSGVLGGPVTAGLAAIISLVYRITLGGAGTLMGVSVIISSALLGVIYFYLHSGKTRYFGNIHFYLFGFIVHVVMLIMMFLLPMELFEEIVTKIALPVLIFYPITTFFLLYILNDLELKNAGFKKLKKNERLLRLFVKHSPSSIAMFDKEMKYIIYSKRYLMDFNLGQQDLVGRSHYEVFPEIPKRWKEIHQRCLAGATESSNEDPFARADGTMDWVRWEILPWYENENEIGGIILLSEVITEKKVAIDSLKESENYNRTLFDNSIIGLAVTELDGKLVDINKAYADIIGRTIEETKQLTYWDITPDKYSQQEKEQLHKLNTLGQYGPYEKEYIHKNGYLVPVRLQGLLIERDGKKLIWSSVENITQQKQLDEALRSSENKFSLLFRKSALPMTLSSFPDFVFLDINDTWTDMFGYTKEEVIGKTSAEVGLNPDVENRTKMINELSKIRSANNIETKIISKSGKVLNILVNFNVIEIDGKENALVSIQDITDRKLIEIKLTESEKRYRTLFEYAPDGILIADTESNYLDANSTMCSMLGYTREEIIGLHAKDIVVPSELKFVEQALDVISSGSDYGREWKFQRKDGTTFSAEVIVTNLPDGNLIALVRDITERKLAEQKIIESEERLRLSTELGGVAVWDYDFINNTMSRSRNHDTLYGLEWQTKWDINTFLNATHPDDREYSNEIIQNSVASGGPDRYAFDFRVVYPDESIHWLMVTGQVIERNEKGEGIRVRGSLIDITERKEAEEKLQKSEESFSKIFQNSPFPINLFRFSDGCSINVNDAFLNMTGYLREEIINHSAEDLDLFVNQTQRNIWLSEIKEYGKAQIAETKIRKKSGELIDVIGTIEIIEIGDEKFGLSMAIDITENKKMRIELGKSKKQFKSIAENLPGVITQYKIKPDGTDEHLYVSEGTMDIWNLPQEDVLKDTSLIWNMVDDRDKNGLKASVEESFKNLNPWEYEWRIKLADQSIKWLQGMGLPQKYEDGSVVWDTMILDNTHRKQMEEQLELSNTSLRELFANLDRMREEERKKVARELHDELGQVITSIKMNLSLLQNSVQMDKYNKQHIISEINEMQNIIDISKDNLKDLIRFLRPEFLDNLGIIVALNHIIDQSVRSTDIDIEFIHNFEEITIAAEVENTIFRVIQEGLTNIIKHSKATKVKITLDLTSEVLKILISDNGIGIKSSDLEKKNSLGIVGIRERLKIIGSDLILDSEESKGTQLKFSVKVHK